MRPLLLIFPVIGIAAQEQSICMEEDEADASEVSSERQHKRPVLLFHDKWRKESEIDTSASGPKSKRILTFR